MTGRQQNSEFDLILVGGGPVGLTFALGMLEHIPDFRIALCDRRADEVPKDQRATALSAGVQKVLETLGVWSDLIGDAMPISHMRITDSGRGDLTRPVFLRFDGDVLPGQPYAYMVSNQVLARSLIDRVANRLSIFAPAVTASLIASGSKMVLGMEDGAVLAAPLIVGADGVNSFVRQRAGIKVIDSDYGQSALVGTIEHEMDHERTAFEHFRPQGPFASLPLAGGHHSSIVWCETKADADRYLSLHPADLAREVEQAMGSGLGKVTVPAPLQRFDLRMRIARDFIGERVALAGDAAHVIHPVAGQGLNMGIKDVAALIEVLVEAVRIGEDYGGDAVLERYQMARRFDVALMNFATDGLTRLFSNENAGLRAIRDLGLGLVDRTPALKTGLIRRAAGVPSGLKLMQGRMI